MNSMFRIFKNQYRLFSLDQKKSRTFTEVWLGKFYKENPHLNPHKQKKKDKKQKKEILKFNSFH